MPWRQSSPDDPAILTGVTVPAENDRVREMVAVFAEEFARLGYDEELLLHLFQDPFYSGPHGAYRRLGKKAVQEIISDSVATWGRVRFTTRDKDSQGDPGLLKIVSRSPKED